MNCCGSTCPELCLGFKCKCKFAVAFLTNEITGFVDNGAKAEVARVLKKTMEFHCTTKCCH